MAFWLFCQSCQQWSRSATPLSDDKSCSFCSNRLVKTKHVPVTGGNIQQTGGIETEGAGIKADLPAVSAVEEAPFLAGESRGKDSLVPDGDMAGRVTEAAAEKPGLRPRKAEIVVEPAEEEAPAEEIQEVAEAELVPKSKQDAAVELSWEEKPRTEKREESKNVEVLAEEQPQLTTPEAEAEDAEILAVVEDGDSEVILSRETVKPVFTEVKFIFEPKEKSRKSAEAAEVISDEFSEYEPGVETAEAEPIDDFPASETERAEEADLSEEGLECQEEEEEDAAEDEEAEERPEEVEIDRFTEPESEVKSRIREKIPEAEMVKVSEVRVLTDKKEKRDRQIKKGRR